jgi:hypothetical protein
LRRVGGCIFGLSSDYFVTSSKRDTIDEVCRLLGTTPRSHNYPIFPPVLFPNAVVDASNSTVFGNWKPLAQVHCHFFVYIQLLTTTMSLQQILKAVLMGEASLTSVKKGGPPRNFKIWGVSTITPGAIAWSATFVSGSFYCSCHR